MSREAETDSLQRALDSGDDCSEAVRALRWIKDFCEAHHAGEPAGVHLHRLLVDIPHYLDYVLATLETQALGATTSAVFAVDPAVTERPQEVLRAPDSSLGTVAGHPPTEAQKDDCANCGHGMEHHNMAGLWECYAPKPGGGICQCRKYWEPDVAAPPQEDGP